MDIVVGTVATTTTKILTCGYRYRVARCCDSVKETRISVSGKCFGCGAGRRRWSSNILLWSRRKNYAGFVRIGGGQRS